MKISTKFSLPNLANTDTIFQALLQSRGISHLTSEDFFNPQPPTLAYLTSQLHLNQAQLTSAKALIQHHLQQGSDILIYGDYDADGITATAILYQTLTKLARSTSARILPFIPDRERHGYGISETSLADIYSGKAFIKTTYVNFSPKLIITVDTGIVANSAVQSIKQHQLDIIITDHHQPTNTLPSANVIIHSLVSSGSIVAWTLALFLTNEDSLSKSLLDLAIVGMVADQIPLLGINRSLAVHGLKALRQTNNLGLKQLFISANRQLSQLTIDNINYTLAPRLNASGRLANALLSLKLLCSHRQEQILNLTAQIEQLNQQRRQLTLSATKHALQQPSSHKLIITASPDYHRGVVGLIAGRLAEHYQRPALAISLGDKFAHGSARSVEDIDITQFLRQVQSEFIGLGGHKLASGFSFLTSNLQTLSQHLYQLADKQFNHNLLTPTRFVDTQLQLGQTSLELVKLIQSLAPFGVGNPQPIFVSYNLDILKAYPLGQQQTHYRFVLNDHGVIRQAIWFNSASQLPSPLPSQLKIVIYTLNANRWQNQTNLQLMIKYAQF